MPYKPMKGTITPVSIRPIIEGIVLTELSIPSLMGKTKLPDPKNIENIANPAVIDI